MTPTPAEPTLAQQIEQVAPEVPDGASSDATDQSGAAAAPAPLAAPTAFSLREAGKAAGLDLSSYGDDAAAAQALFGHLQGMQEAQRGAVEQAQREVVLRLQAHPDWQAFEKHRKEKEAQAPAKPFWAGPEFDPAWEEMIEADEAGNPRVKAGYDPTILPKLQAARKHQRQLLHQMVSDPETFITKVMEGKLGKLVEERLGAKLAGQQEDVQRQTFLHANAHWMVAQDAEKRPVTGPDGQMQLSQAGQLFVQLANQAHQMGIQGVPAQQQWALREMELALYRMGGSPQAQSPAPQAATPSPPVVPPRQAANQAFLTRGNPSHGASRNGAPPVNGQGTFRDAMAAALTTLTPEQLEQTE